MEAQEAQNTRIFKIKLTIKISTITYKQQDNAGNIIHTNHEYSSILQQSKNAKQTKNKTQKKKKQEKNQ